MCWKSEAEFSHTTSFSTIFSWCVLLLTLGTKVCKTKISIIKTHDYLWVYPTITVSVKQVSKITKMEFYQGNYLSRTAPVNVFHSWLLFDESSRSLLTPSFLSHCQASLLLPHCACQQKGHCLLMPVSWKWVTAPCHVADLWPDGTLCSGTKEHGFPHWHSVPLSWLLFSLKLGKKEQKLTLRLQALSSGCEMYSTYFISASHKINKVYSKLELFKFLHLKCVMIMYKWW